jgi:hypothetical protein
MLHTKCKEAMCTLTDSCLYEYRVMIRIRDADDTRTYFVYISKLTRRICEMSRKTTYSEGDQK